MKNDDPKNIAVLRLKAFIKLCREAGISKTRAKEMVDYFWPKKTGLWPECNGWWQNGPTWLHDLTSQYQYLSPILTQLKYCPPLPRLKGMDIVTETIGKGEKRYHYALIDLNDENKARIADKAGCSIPTLKRYLATLVKCGVVKEFNKGRLGRYYSMSYWIQYKNPETKNWDYKRNPLLTHSTLGNLKEFKVNWSN